jgi:preprotein translocase subunit SecD
LRQNIYAWLVGILLITLLAGYIDLVDQTGIGGFLQRDTHLRYGLDLEGGLELVLQAYPLKEGDTISSDQLEAARTIIEDRANGTGASEPVVQTAEGNRILVELPGISNMDQAREVIQQTAFLEILDGGSSPPAIGSQVCTTLGNPRIEQTTSVGATPTPAPTVAASGTVTATHTTTSTAQTTPVASPTPFTCDKVWTTIIRGDQIDGNQVKVTFDSANRPQVAFALKNGGAEAFGNFTSANVGKYMPITLDKKVISSPVIQSPITGGQGVINNMSLSEAQTLALQLKYGALPVGLSLQSERKISATLGQDAINKSIVAGIVGIALVMFFMIVYFRLPGVLASIALIIYAIIALALFKLVPVTLTLAGIAGFILSIGMAVDANVLIFSRMKEELRTGKTLGAAVEAGFDHAWLSIRDSNISTIITCIILFWFGSTFGGASIIKGFALTLGIGVVVSLFTAITVTRTLLRAIVNTPLARNKWMFHMETAKPPTAGTAPGATEA